MGRFDDRMTTRLPTARDMLRLLRSGGFRPPASEIAKAALVPRHTQARLRPGPSESAVTWVGHATTLVETGGRRFVTDPIWSKRLPGRIQRLTAPGVPLQEALPLDGILVSHNHYDHLDAPTVRRMPRDTPVFVPLGVGRWFRRRGFREVQEADWWDAFEHRGVRLTCVPMHHWSRRTLWDTNATLWGGWVLQAPGQEPILFAGDTAYGTRFKEIRERLGPVGTAILPIGAYEPSWFMRPVHMDPDEAVQAADDLEAKRLVAMHWGTFPLTREPLLQPPERLRAAWLRAGHMEGDLWLLALGETRIVPPVARQA